MKLSARNQLKGTVTRLDIGPISAEVELAVGDQVVVAVITAASARGLGLQVGSTAYAVIKASNVMVGIDD
jgi:molybdopterin-binding protein